MRLTAQDGSVSLQQHSAAEPSHHGEERLTPSQVTNGSGIFEQFKRFTKNVFKIFQTQWKVKATRQQLRWNKMKSYQSWARIIRLFEMKPPRLRRCRWMSAAQCFCQSFFSVWGFLLSFQNSYSLIKMPLLKPLILGFKRKISGVVTQELFVLTKLKFQWAHLSIFWDRMAEMKKNLVLI